MSGIQQQQQQANGEDRYAIDKVVAHTWGGERPDLDDPNMSEEELFDSMRLLVVWEGYPGATWEPCSTIRADAPQAFMDYMELISTEGGMLAAHWTCLILGYPDLPPPEGPAWDDETNGRMVRCVYEDAGIGAIPPHLWRFLPIPAAE